jgi:hypothetical protein
MLVIVSRAMHRLAACTLLSLLPLACVVQVNDGGSGDAPGQGDEASKPNGSGSEVTEPEAEGEPPARASVPELPDCPADADADTYCTEDGKLAGRWVPVDTVNPPASAVAVFEALHPELEKQPSLVIKLDGETLYIEKVTCGSCRRVIGQGFSGQLDVLSDEQLRALQTKLGLGREPPLLDTAEAWRAFAGQDPGKALLTKLSTAVD